MEKKEEAVTKEDYTLIARALDTYVNEYSGAAPEVEIERVEELAEHFWLKANGRDRDGQVKRG